MDNGALANRLPTVPFDFSKYQAVLLDLDGTLFNSHTALPGAKELVARLLAHKQRLAVLSNSTQSPQRVARKIGGIGFNLPTDLVFTAAGDATDYCLSHFSPQPRIFNLATEGVQELLDGKVTWVEHEGQPCDAVVVGNPACVWATPPRMRSAMRLLCQGAACLGICADRIFPSDDGLEIGSGALTAMLAFAAHVEPVFFGKPQKAFFERLCQRLSVAPDRTILVGDNLESDIGGAKAVGMATILSLTGVTRRADLENLPPERKPDWVVDDLRSI